MLAREHLDAPARPRRGSPSRLQRAHAARARCRLRSGGPGAGSSPAASPGRSTRCCTSPSPDGTERVLLDPDRARPHRPDHARRLGARPRGPPAGLPALRRRRRAVGAARARRRHRRATSRRRSTAAATPPSRGCPAARSSSTSGMVDPDEVPPGEQAFHRRIWRHRVGTPTDARRAGRRPRPLRDAQLLRGRRLRRRPLAGRHRRTSARPAATACGSRTCTATARPDSRAHPGRRRAVRAPGWTATAGSTCTPPTAPRASGSASPTPRTPAASTGASWSPRTRTRCWRPCAAGARGLADPADGLLVLAAARHAVAEVALHDPRRRAPRRGPAARARLAARAETADPDTPGQAGHGCGSAGPTSSPRRRCTGSTSPPATTVLDDRRSGRGRRCRPCDRAAAQFTSADGTTVRMFVVSPAGDRAARGPPCSPATAASAISRDPAYSASTLAWVAAGGVYALVSLRGGGEEGEEWHLAGNRGQQAERVRRLPRRRHRR